MKIEFKTTLAKKLNGREYVSVPAIKHHHVDSADHWLKTKMILKQAKKNGVLPERIFLDCVPSNVVIEHGFITTVTVKVY